MRYTVQLARPDGPNFTWWLFVVGIFMGYVAARVVSL